MDSHYALLIFEIVFSLCSIVYAITRRQPARLDQTSGRLVLEYHPAIRIAAYLAWGLDFVIILLTFKFPFNSRFELFLTAGMFLLFFLLGLYLYLEGKCRVELDEHGISAWSPWRGSTAFSWADVAEVIFQPTSSYFVVISVDRKKIRINAPLMRGVQPVCQIVQ